MGSIANTDQGKNNRERLGSKDMPKLFLWSGLLVFPLLVVLSSLVFPAVMGRQSDWFGVNQISGITLSDLSLVFLVSLILLLSCFLLLRSKLWRIAGLLLIFSVMFFFKSNTPNQDGQDLLWKIPTDVDRVGAHVVHDEMLELYVHSVFWNLANKLYDLSVASSYQILSVLSGTVFMLLLSRYTRETINSGKLLFMLLVSSGGFIQLFFGDVENYSITAVLVIWYLLVGTRVVKRGTSSWMAALILGLAMCFHLEAGFLLPSLAYLAQVGSLDKKQQMLRVAKTLLIPLAMVLLCVMIFDWLGMLPLENLWLYSHATAHGGDLASVIPPMTVPYYLEMFNLLILLFPAILMLPFVLVFKKLSKVNVFLLIATGFLMLLPLAWKAALGVLNDWNLYAMLAIPGSILVWSLAVRDIDSDRSKYILTTVLVFSLLNTFSWVLKNHAG